MVEVSDGERSGHAGAQDCSSGAYAGSGVEFAAARHSDAVGMVGVWMGGTARSMVGRDRRRLHRGMGGVRVSRASPLECDVDACRAAEAALKAAPERSAGVRQAWGSRGR